MNYLVTGGAGFIGSHIVISLLKNKHNSVHNVDKLSYCSDLSNLEECTSEPNYHFVHANLCNVSYVSRLFERCKFDVVIHLAAESHVSNSFQDPIEFSQNNINSTHSLLEACRRYPVKRFLYVSTDEVYGGDHKIPVSERTVLRPTNPYSASKAACEHLVCAYHSSFKIPSLVVRLNNVFGPHQHSEKVIPRFIQSLLRGDKCTIEGSGKQKRSFLYISDAVSGIMAVLERGEIGEAYNIGTEFNISIYDLVFELLSHIHPKIDSPSESDAMEFIPDRPHNDMMYPVDCKKIGKLGWSVQVRWEVGIKQTIQWYKWKAGMLTAKL